MLQTSTGEQIYYVDFVTGLHYFKHKYPYQIDTLTLKIHQTPSLQRHGLTAGSGI
jgi:hypothetical protein